MVKPRDNRIPIMFSEEELRDIDEWRFENRIATRADAVRRLCKIGMLLEEEFEQVVDVASDGVEILSDQASEMFELYRQVLHPAVSDVRYGQHEIGDVIRLANRHAEVADEGIRALHQMAVTIYNAVAEIVGARTLRSGVLKSQQVIADANAAVERSNQKHQERKENRYIWVINMTPEEHALYEAVPDDDQEEYLDKRIAAMQAEEEADAEAFAIKYKLPKPFWEQPDWVEKMHDTNGVPTLKGQGK